MYFIFLVSSLLHCFISASLFFCQLVASFIYFQKFELIGFQNTCRRRDQWVSFVPHQALIPASLHPESLPSFLPSIQLNACARPLRLRLRLRQASNVNAAAHQPIESRARVLDPRSSNLALARRVSCQLRRGQLTPAKCAMHGESPTAGCVGCNFNQGATG